MRPFLIGIALCFGIIQGCYAQPADTVKHYFIISTGTTIHAFFNDRPLSVESIEDFNQYVQANVKSLKDSWVVVTGKPKNGTFDEVLKILNRYRFKHVSKNIVND